MGSSSFLSPHNPGVNVPPLTHFLDFPKIWEESHSLGEQSNSSTLRSHRFEPQGKSISQPSMTSQVSDLDLEKLCHRAIPGSHAITRAEYNVIWGWPPPEEQDRVCVEKTGHTRAELVTKAVATPEDLTRDEAMIVYHPLGVRSKLSVAYLILPGETVQYHPSWMSCATRRRSYSEGQ